MRLIILAKFGVEALVPPFRNCSPFNTVMVFNPLAETSGKPLPVALYTFFEGLIGGAFLPKYELTAPS
jgi:hypothetical protein